MRRITLSDAAHEALRKQAKHDLDLDERTLKIVATNRRRDWRGIPWENRRRAEENEQAILKRIETRREIAAAVENWEDA